MPQAVGQIDRTKYIGGSDVAGILGISPWRTPLDVYLDKIQPRVEPVDPKKQKIFTYQFGLHEDLKHIPAISSERGELTYVYAVAKLKDGGLQFEVMSKYEIDPIRAQSKASGSGPWATHYEEMAKKTVIRRLFKYLPVSIEMTRAVIADESADAGISQENASILTGEFDENDIIDVDQETGEVLNTPQAEDEKSEPPEKSEPAEKTAQAIDFKPLLNSIKTSTDLDVLDADASLIDQVVEVSNREELSRAYKARRAELEGK